MFIYLYIYICINTYTDIHRHAYIYINTYQFSPRSGVIYVVGGQGAPGLLADVWASDTAGRSWSRMCAKAPFGHRAGVACATVPGNPLVLIVAGGVSDDVHRDLWVTWSNAFHGIFFRLYMVLL